MKARHVLGILFFSFFVVSSNSSAQNVTYDSLPAPYQLYPRNEVDNDSAIITIKGAVDISTIYDSVIVEIDTNNVLWQRQAQVLAYNGNSATFLLKPKIFADTIEFSFEVLFRKGTDITSNILVENVVCGDVYLINGQSNAVAWDPVFFVPHTMEWVRTFGPMSDKDGAHGDTQGDTTWDLAQARLGVWRYNIGIIGLRLGKLISEIYGIPVCIINGAAGGTEIKKHLRNDLDHDDLDTIYGRLLYRVEKAGLIKAVKALFWWQGEGNTGGPTGANNYYNRFQIIRNAWREDFIGIEKVYTAQLHVGSGATAGTGALAANLVREYQRKLALEDPATDIMSTDDIGGFHTDLTHFTANGYEIVGDRIFGQIRRDFYNYVDTTDINPPNVTRAYFTSAQKNVLVLEFDNTPGIIWQNDSTIDGTTRYLRDYFYLHNASTTDSFIVSSAQSVGNLLRLQLSTSSNVTSLTYLPNSYYNGTTTLYEGPWLRNSKGIPALSFYQFPIDAESGDDPLPVVVSSFSANYTGGAIQLKWRTESEMNNLGFIVLKKKENEESYFEISSYESNPALIGQGTTTQPTDYSLIDDNVIIRQTYLYLLQDVNMNGVKITHGPVKITATEPSKPEGIN